MGSELVEKHAKRNIAFGTILGYVNLFLGIVSGLVFTPWIIKTISNSSYGIYTLSSSLISLFLLDFGLGATANRYLAKYKAEGDKAKVESFLGIIYKFYLIIDVLILLCYIVAFFLIDYIYVGLTISERSTFKSIFIISACFSLISFPSTVMNGVISAYEEFVWAKLVDLLNKILYVVLTLAALLCGWGLYGLVIANVSAGLVCIIAKFIIIKVKLSVRADFRFKAENGFVKEIIMFSLWAGIASIAARLVFNVTPSILGIVSDSTNIAIFGVISTIEGYVYSFGSIMSGVFIPKLSRIEKDDANPQPKIDQLAIKAGKYQAFVVILIVVGFACCGKEFISWWLKDDATYSQAYLGILLIIIYQIVNVPQSVYISEMYTNNGVKQYAIVEIIKSIVNLGLSFLFSYYWGAIGACISIAISRTLEIILLNVCYKRIFHADLSQFYKNVFIPFLWPTALALMVGLLFHYFLPFSAGLNFLIIGLFATLVFSVSSYIHSFSDSEIDYLKAAVGINSKPRKKWLGIKAFMTKDKMVVPSIFLLVFCVAAVSVGVTIEERIHYISTISDFYGIKNDLKGRYRITVNAINLTDDWIPLGTKDEPFSGTIEADNCTISNLIFDGQNDNGVINLGIFAYNSGTIKGLSVWYPSHDYSFDDDSSSVVFGTIAANNSGKIQNCFAATSGSTSLINVSSSSNITCGSLVGINDGGTLDMVASRINQTLKSSDGSVISGSIVGELKGGNVLNAYSNGVSSIDSASSAECAYGGIVGYARFADECRFKIQDCYSSSNKLSIGGPSIYGCGFIGAQEEGCSGDIVNGLSGFSCNQGNEDFSDEFCQFKNRENIVATNCYYLNEITNSHVKMGVLAATGSLSLSALGWSSSVWDISSGSVIYKGNQ